MIINKNQLQNITKLWHFFPTKRKSQVIALIFFMIFSSFFEMISIGAILPFLGVIASPETILVNPYVNPISNFLNINSRDEIRFFVILIFIFSVLIAGISRLLLMFSSTRLMFSTGIDLSKKIFKRTLNISYATHIQFNSSYLINIVFNKCNDVIYCIMLPITTLFSSIIQILAILLILILIEPILMTSCFLLFGLSYSLILIFTRSRVQRNSNEIANESNKSIK